MENNIIIIKMLILVFFFDLFILEAVVTSTIMNIEFTSFIINITNFTLKLGHHDKYLNAIVYSFFM
jgi:hypothetical protein